MTKPDSKKADIPPVDPIPPSQPASPSAEVPRSGAGAGTALSAMLKKRQMRVTRDADPDPQSAVPPARKKS